MIASGHYSAGQIVAIIAVICAVVPVSVGFLILFVEKFVNAGNTIVVGQDTIWYTAGIRKYRVSISSLVYRTETTKHNGKKDGYVRFLIVSDTQVPEPHIICAWDSQWTNFDQWQSFVASLNLEELEYISVKKIRTLQSPIRGRWSSR